ncbi:MAG: ABC-type branched-chain amino acid transport system, substrate-binding protein [Arthrobacter sp.]|jgi:ABC-type branched-subunit amino acid transport system substrate-binding protein|nr:ABC-type branched-chain amino acid transport system, substrate-binding protein [Arthrobacter sp.]
MRSKRAKTFGTLCAATLVISACGGGDGGDDGGGGAADAIKLGVLTSLSGVGTAGFTGVEDGVNARLGAYKADSGECAGRGFDVVMADDTSTPQGALSAVQKAVQQEQVYALLNTSSFFFGAAQFMTTQGSGTPVLGGGFDSAPQWTATTSTNLFPAPPVADYSDVYSTLGEYHKDVGVTKLAGVGYDVRSAANSVLAALVSAEAAGVGRGYVNITVPYGTTDVGAIVLGIIESGSDGVYLSMTPDTGFAIVAGLRQAGYTPKSVIVATGYGADLLESPPAVAAGQGASFSTSFAPVELHTEATDYLSAALKEHAGSESGIPSFSQAMGWMSADLFLHGLEAAGCDASQEEFIATLRKDTSWDANGLLPSSLDFTKPGGGPAPCTYISTLQGSEFVPAPEASPACGESLGEGVPDA